MNRPNPRARWTSGAALLGTAAMVAATATAPATADDAPTAREAARHKAEGSVLGVYDHLFKFEEIADDNGGNRASGLPGYRASRNYVVRSLKRAGYKPQVQTFSFPFFQQTAPSTFERTAPAAKSYVEDEDYGLMTYSGSGDETAPVQVVDPDFTPPSPAEEADNPTLDSGCTNDVGTGEPEDDFVDFTPGNIALIQRGGCSFGEKVANAQDAGAVGAIIFNTGNEGNTSAFAGTLGAPQEGQGIPAIGTSFAIGEELAAEGTEAHLATSTESEIRDTWNVIAQTRGNRQNVVMAGAHLDSVPEGNGINDNGSGSAALLETAEALAEKKRKPTNKVRFAWWGAEELGLLGSEHYVSDLQRNKPTRARFQNIALYLNFDMVGSPNYVLGVYDGNGNSFDPPVSTEAPEGSAPIERTFHRYFRKIGTGSVDTAFSGRSDYGPFIEVNVPAGGLFTGAEGVKTAEEAAMFGGTAGVAYDPNYHQVGDTIGNVSRKALTANLGAIKNSVFKYARSTRSVNGKRTGHEPPSNDTSARRSLTRAQQGPEHRRDYHAAHPTR